MQGNVEYSCWARGWKWANYLATKMGRQASAPVNLETTFIFMYKVQQFEDDYRRDAFIRGYRDYHKHYKNKG